MANQYVNKVETSDGTTLVDLTGDTVNASALAAGYTAHDRSGAPITGTYAQQQADWAQYDSNAADYIKNRPFYYDHDVTTVLPQTTFGGGYADYDVTISGATYALVQENVSLSADIEASTQYRATVSGTASDATSGTSTTYTLSGAGSTKTVTGIPLVVSGKCVIVRTASKKATVLLYGSAGQDPVSSKAVKVELVVADAFAQIDPMFLPAATSAAYGAVKVDAALDGTSANPVQNQAVKDALDDKLDEEDYLGGLTWNTLKAKFTWDDLAGNTGSDAHTANLNLSKPARLSTTAVNGNMDIIDTAVAGKAATNHNHSGGALTPASVAATGAVSGNSISDGAGTLAQLRESVSKTLISKSEDYTASTDWFYTGLSLTIPANSIFSIYVEAVYVNCSPTGVSIQNFRNNSPVDCPYDIISQGVGHVTASGYTTSSKTIYVWAKYNVGNQNGAILNAWYMPAQ